MGGIGQGHAEPGAPTLADLCIGYEIENDVVIQPLEGGQELGQPGLGHVAPGYSSVCNRCATHLDALRN